MAVHLPSLHDYFPRQHFNKLHHQRLQQVQIAPKQNHAAARCNENASTITCRSSLSATLYDLHDRQIQYEKAWSWQKLLVEEVCTAATRDERGPCSSGAAILLQHEPVYTLGAGATEEHLRFDPETPPLPLFRTERGGEVTYHGPGQLVIALAEVSGLEGKRVPGLTGVWVGDKKVAAIGVRATKWVSYHGLALNVTADLSPFRDIVPCGIADKPVTSAVDLLIDQALEDDPYAERNSLLEVLHGKEFQRQLLEEYRYGLVAAFEEVFGVEWGRIIEGNEAVDELERLRKGKNDVETEKGLLL